MNGIGQSANGIIQPLGSAGVDVISGTGTFTPTGAYYSALYVTATANMSACTAHASAPITGTITGIAFAAGLWIHGRFTSVTLASGSMLAYRELI